MIAQCKNLTNSRKNLRQTTIKAREKHSKASASLPSTINPRDSHKKEHKREN
jgi:hypothetical protein